MTNELTTVAQQVATMDPAIAAYLAEIDKLNVKHG
jgi:hypothetical protein